MDEKMSEKMDDLINDLLQRAETCDALTPRAIPGDAMRMEDVGRLKGKAEAYRHAAEIAREALGRGAEENERLRAEVDFLEAAQSSARREGAEVMREECAKQAEHEGTWDIAAAIRAIPLPEARPPATVPCGMCGGRGKVLLGREVEDGCDECGASGRVDAVAEVARLRERVKHYQMQATHHAIVDMDAREAAKREADALRAQLAEARRLLAAAARGELPRCDAIKGCDRIAVTRVADLAVCDGCGAERVAYWRAFSDGDAGRDAEREDLPHAAALRAVMG